MQTDDSEGTSVASATCSARRAGAALERLRNESCSGIAKQGVLLRSSIFAGRLSST